MLDALLLKQICFYVACTSDLRGLWHSPIFSYLEFMSGSGMSVSLHFSTGEQLFCPAPPSAAPDRVTSPAACFSNLFFFNVIFMLNLFFLLFLTPLNLSVTFWKRAGERLLFALWLNFFCPFTEWKRKQYMAVLGGLIMRIIKSYLNKPHKKSKRVRIRVWGCSCLRPNVFNEWWSAMGPLHTITHHYGEPG